MTLNIDIENPNWLNRKNGPEIFKEEEPEFYFKSEDIYESLDSEYFSKMSVEFDPSESLPYGAKTLGTNIEKSIYNGLRNAIDTWYMNVTKNTSLDKLKLDLKASLLKWQADSTTQVSNDIQKLFEKGIKAGVKQSGVVVEQKYYDNINYEINRETGIVPALENFQNQIYDKVSGILTKNYNEVKNILPVQKTKDDINSYIADQRYRTELMIKSETASFAHYGMLKAWDNYSDKAKYRYYWKAIIDKRTKPISIIRKQGNPYTFEDIKFLWTHQKQKINGKWMNDKFFQRCGIARGKYKLDYNWTVNHFQGKESDFEETL